MLKKALVFSEVPFLVIAWPWVSVPLNFRPMTYYRKGGTTPHLSFALWEAQLFGWHSYSYGHSQCYEYLNYYKLGVGLIDGVIVILTRGMGERLTYEIPARYRVVLVEHLGGLFFDDRRSCAGDSFAGHSGLSDNGCLGMRVGVDSYSNTPSQCTGGIVYIWLRLDKCKLHCDHKFCHVHMYQNKHVECQMKTYRENECPSHNSGAQSSMHTCIICTKATARYSHVSYVSQ